MGRRQKNSLLMMATYGHISRLSVQTHPPAIPAADAPPLSIPPPSLESSCPHVRSAHPFAHSSSPKSVLRESLALRISDPRRPLPSHKPVVLLSASLHPSRPHPAE